VGLGCLGRQKEGGSLPHELKLTSSSKPPHLKSSRAVADVDGKYPHNKLTDADRLAARLLRNPLVKLEDEGPAKEIHTLAIELGAEKPAKRITDAIPESATHDPESWVTDAVVPWSDAGLYLGFCLGFRVARAMNTRGKAVR